MEASATPNKEGKKPLILIAVLVLIVAAAAIFVLLNSSKNKNENQNQNQNEVNESSDNGEAEVNLSAEEIENLSDASVDVENEELKRLYLVENAELGQLRSAAPGTSLITYDEKVVNDHGQEVKNDAPPMSEGAPKPSDFLYEKEIPSFVLRLVISQEGFTPSTFSTKSGAVTTFSLTSEDVLAHNVTFDDPSLSGVYMLVGPGQTRALTFKAPVEPGEYTFRCASADHPQGEVGKMIVVK